MSRQLNRRQFIAGSAAAGAGFWIAGRQVGYGQEKSANAKLNIVSIGCGGRGGEDLKQVASETIVGLCDVDERRIGAASKLHPNAKTYSDFRKVFDDAKTFDAVVVATAEHTHAFATLPALQLGKHVYCEKPLTHGVWEARVVREAAQKAKVATQMGTQVHATDNFRRVVELVQSGAVGKVTECHVWVSRTWGRQPESEAQANGDIISSQERPAEDKPVPPYLNWDLWIGPAPMRPFHEIYFPGPRWYRWWDFGSGTMSDLGSHWNDLPFWALKLDAPRTIEGFGPPPHPEIAPASFRAVYEYGPRGDMPACTLTWYQGQEKPPALKDGRIPPAWKDGVLFVGDKGMLVSNYSKHALLPEDQFKDFKRPEQTIPKSIGHHAEWINAAKTDLKTTCHFGYSGPLTEANHLGSIAYRLGKKLEWDAANLKCTNAPEADRLLHREYRKGWELKA
ncbi:MAG TPA: Gfo/Idh/MocA family oxidoreductase [Planctomycetota bacterium]|jgi:predicted dehydrogenase|nr:Gfo/Idh/MocA family oxidoreductase [Planctomycetota bacterium]